MWQFQPKPGHLQSPSGLSVIYEITSRQLLRFRCRPGWSAPTARLGISRTSRAAPAVSGRRAAGGRSTAPAETEEFRSPVPTRMVSNGEYMPIAQTEKQKRVEARIKELANSASKKLGINRRKFLVTSGGMAACFVAMNEVYGKFFDVDPVEMFELAASA